MSLLEVKNNLLKFCYEEDLILSGFVRVTDPKNSYIAQVLHLEATRVGKVAIAKILFMYNNEEISSYNGSIPSLRAEISSIDPSILLNTLEKSAPLNLGVLAQQNQKLFVDMSVLKDNPIICAEKFFATKVFLNNLAIQLQHNHKKVVVFDTVGIFNSNKLTLGKDFKLPLNTSAINYVYEHGFEDATSDTKALIQSIFEELSEYSKTVPFIPFNSFKAVVDAEFNRTKLIQLILLKNKIKQIGDLNIYGETENDFALLNSKIKSDNTIVIDISGVVESLQKECIKYVYSLLRATGEEFYTFLPLNNGNSDKTIFTEIYGTENVNTTVICGYDYKYLNLLKQTSKNMFMFTPLKQQKDFGGYNIFLQKLAEDEYIAYGKMTKFVPLIVKLHPIKADEIVVTPSKMETNTMVENFVNSITPESIEIETTKEESVEEVVMETTEEVPAEEPVASPEETFEPVQTTELPLEEETEEEEDDIEEEEFASQEEEEVAVVPEETPQPVVEEPVEEITPQEEEEDDEEEEEEFASQEEEEYASLEEPETATESELADALNEVPDIEDDDELSDDDLDMIEELSNPEENVEEVQEEVAIAPEETPQPVAEQPVTPQPAPQPAPMTPPQSEKPQVMQNTNPTVPVYSADIPEEDKVGGAKLQQGDRVLHEEFGEGVVEKMINYGDKELCSINFASVGRRLLNPEITEMRKI